MLEEKIEFCQCEHPSSVTSGIGDFCFWLVCCDCYKPIEDSFEYYNHYDGEDHAINLY